MWSVRGFVKGPFTWYNQLPKQASSRADPYLAFHLLFGRDHRKTVRGHHRPFPMVSPLFLRPGHSVVVKVLVRKRGKPRQILTRTGPADGFMPTRPSSESGCADSRRESVQPSASPFGHSSRPEGQGEIISRSLPRPNAIIEIFVFLRINRLTRIEARDFRF